MKKTFLGLLRSETIVKNIFNGIGYFLLVATVCGILKEYPPWDNWFGVLCIFISYLTLYFLAAFYWLVYVIQPIIKLSWPEFGIPLIDESTERISYLQLLKRIDIILYGGLAYMSLSASTHFIISFIKRI